MDIGETDIMIHYYNNLVRLIYNKLMIYNMTI